MTVQPPLFAEVTIRTESWNTARAFQGLVFDLLRRAYPDGRTARPLVAALDQAVRRGGLLATWDQVAVSVSTQRLSRASRHRLGEWLLSIGAVEEERLMELRLVERLEGRVIEEAP